MQTETRDAFFAALDYLVSAFSWGYDNFGDLLSIFSFTCATLLLTMTLLRRKLETNERAQRCR